MHPIRSLCILFSFAFLSGCSSLSYYSQAIGGHLEIMRKSKDIEQWLEDKELDDRLRARLEFAISAKAFAIRELHLPNNDSYTQYADLERPYVVWNVVATPALSLTPVKSCFFIVGCLSYRGYFDKAMADERALELKQQGFDVYAGGVAAYSTLGWFDDPLLNTMMHWSDTRLAGLIFHELAHQLLYVEDDSEFNEAFATSVQRIGISRWLSEFGTPKDLEQYQIHLRRESQFLTLLAKYRDQLQALYASEIADADKIAQKPGIFYGLKKDYESLRLAWLDYRGYDAWFENDLNNAKLALVNTYHGNVDAFLALYKQNAGDILQFYHAAKELSRQSKDERDAELRRLSESPKSGTD